MGKSTGKVRKFCQSGKVGTKLKSDVLVHFYMAISPQTMHMLSKRKKLEVFDHLGAFRLPSMFFTKLATKILATKKILSILVNILVKNSRLSCKKTSYTFVKYLSGQSFGNGNIQ